MLIFVQAPGVKSLARRLLMSTELFPRRSTRNTLPVVWMFRFTLPRYSLFAGTLSLSPRRSDWRAFHVLVLVTPH